MKTSKPTGSDTASSRRAQPARQARTNPPRSQANAARSNGGRDETVGGQPLEIFPATTFFADTITALPRELVRHFTLLREVDAKLFAPEEQLFDLVSAAMDTTTTEAQLNRDTTSTTHDTNTTTADTQNGVNGNMESNHDASSTSTANPEAHDQLILRRRQLFRQISFKVQEMLVSLEEKNHVINTANDSLDKQLARIDDVWPYLENEFSDEAKWGSTAHWAYPENRNGKATHPERARRDGAAAISAAAQALADEAAARSDARKQALQAKKSLKASHQDSDFDDHEPRSNKEGKKTGKVRKPAGENNVGLGITAANGTQVQKKRKVENVTGSAGANDRESSAQGTASSKAKGGTDVAGPEPKKRRALPSGPSQPKKRPAKSPSAASSPVIPPLSETKAVARGSPAPSVASRPATSRARGNSIQSVNENGKIRPPSVAAKANGAPIAAPETGGVLSAPRAGSDARSVKESSIPAKGEMKKEVDRTEGPTPATTKETKAQAHERRKSESQPPGQTPATVTTKSGRASKPSTPALATFQEAARPRASRNTDNGGKKGHKKTASNAAPLPPPPVDDEMSSGEGDPDADELRYCYCNGVSYGEMVGCDHDECTREWFHLACVGLRVAPEGQWFCEDCKARLKSSGKKGNTR